MELTAERETLRSHSAAVQLTLSLPAFGLIFFNLFTSLTLRWDSAAVFIPLPSRHH